MSKWLNTTKLILKSNEIEKPCHKLGYCPYGTLVEEFRLRKHRTVYSCKLFGHDCPVFYHGEFVKEE